ncbi:hypothetical protein LINGRAHAP2_LOCUS4008 [Linum grandiflorum]
MINELLPPIPGSPPSWNHLPDVARGILAQGKDFVKKRQKKARISDSTTFEVFRITPSPLSSEDIIQFKCEVGFKIA